MVFKLQVICNKQVVEKTVPLFIVYIQDQIYNCASRISKDAGFC